MRAALAVVLVAFLTVGCGDDGGVGSPSDAGAGSDASGDVATDSGPTDPGGLQGTWEGLSGIASVRLSSLDQAGNASVIGEGTVDAATTTWHAADVTELPLPGLVELLTDDGRVVGSALVTATLHPVTRVTTVRADVALWMAARSAGLGEVDLGLIAMMIDIGTAGAAADEVTNEALATATLTAQEVHSRTTGLDFVALHDASAGAVAALEASGDEAAFADAWSAAVGALAPDGVHAVNLSLQRVGAAREVVLDELSGHQSLLARAAEARGEVLAAGAGVAELLPYLDNVASAQIQLVEAALGGVEAADSDTVVAGQNLAEVARDAVLSYFADFYGAGSSIEEDAVAAVAALATHQSDLAADLRLVVGAGELNPLFVGEDIDGLFRGFDLAVEDSLQSLTVSGALSGDVSMVFELGLHIHGALLGDAF